ncbi:MAG: ATP-binding protein [Desulfuromusa sp.]|jgi:signal transduction histidine kinase|nr:ATP-binding protein [Desulfuromusa sp.]
MRVQHKTYLLLSLILLCSISSYVWVYSQLEHQRLIKELDTLAAQSETAFKTDLDATEMRMLQIVTVIANDQKVQQLFLLGKQSVALEGGNGGGEFSAQVRASLFEYLQKSQTVLAKQFGFRQLHFHLGPGSLSFLRVHQPEKFGDRMDNIRYTVVVANAEQKNTTGFETGRVVSGIRGVAPVYAFDGVTKKQVHVGALEAGTSFTNMLSLFQNRRPGLNAAVLLSKNHMEGTVWPEFLEKLTTENQFANGYYIEATTSPKIRGFLTSNTLLTPSQNMLQDGDKYLYFTSFPLRDFHGERNPEVPDAGVVVLWKDVSHQISGYHDQVAFLIFYSILLFLAIEVLMYFALNLVTGQLQKELRKTQRLETESEKKRLVAEESSRLKTDFLSNMSHELRTPMNTIMGLGQLLGETTLDQQQQKYIDKINLSSKSLLTLIDEILMISDMDAQGMGPLLAENFNPKQLLERVKDNFALKAKNNGVTLTVDFPDQVPSQVEGFPDQIEWALNQLVGNAIKFSPNSHVILSLALHEQTEKTSTLEFSVTDHGVGIAEKQQELIFQPFYQGDGSRTRHYGGTGLGLTIAQKVCHQLGGELKIKSTLGQGSCFSFCLTFTNVTRSAADKPVVPVDPPETQPPSTLLLGSTTELVKILHQLEGPLSKLQAIPCQKIVLSLKDKRWPENLSESVEKLSSLIEQYRFIEAQKVVQQLKESLI